jgi:cbb3-type cytochrome oxidase maturation protein
VEVLILQVFVSLLLVGGSLLLFSYSMRQRDYEQSDRLALLAIAADDARSTPSPEEKQS